MPTGHDKHFKARLRASNQDNTIRLTLKDTKLDEGRLEEDWSTEPGGLVVTWSGE
ncbi:unnamed protein product [Dovyalis caffra]|uniref:Uncharacterized protein n=1 Tax=Dovyalis caffra TaxID=77055 RepID=A0AAV1RQ39_9ROSI|nr:unnamed protein product [Dovyalis caffra]